MHLENEKWLVRHAAFVNYLLKIEMQQIWRFDIQESLSDLR